MGLAHAYRKLLLQLTLVLRSLARRGLARAGQGDQDAEDIVQETLFAIHLKRQSWDEDAPLGPWIRAIARHNMMTRPNAPYSDRRFFRSNRIRRTRTGHVDC